MKKSAGGCGGTAMQCVRRRCCRRSWMSWRGRQGGAARGRAARRGRESSCSGRGMS
nr:MAG TPA: hypothetical protein [Caudoviricetes sp.]